MFTFAVFLLRQIKYDDKANLLRRSYGSIVCCLHNFRFGIRNSFSAVDFLRRNVLLRHKTGRSVRNRFCGCGEFNCFCFFGITAEFLFSALLFSPFSILVFVTRGLRGKRILIRWVVFLAFAAAVYALFVTVFTAIIGIKSDDFVFVGVWGFGVIWSIAFAAFGFVFEKAIDMVAARFKI